MNPITNETTLPPQVQRGRKVQGYVTLIVRDCGAFEPRGTCRWGHRILRDGANIINRNIVDDWTKNDEAFVERVEDGRITIGDAVDPVAICNEANAAAKSSRERELEARLEHLEALIEDLTSPKGKKS